MPELACAVLSLGDERGLIDAVRSLLDQSAPVEVVVVNSGGGDPAARLAAAQLDVRAVSVDGRLYPGAVRNIGIELTQAPFVAFLAADCIATPGWAVGRLREHRAGAVAVASSPGNAYPESKSASASMLLLHNRLLAVNAPPSASSTDSPTTVSSSPATAGSARIFALARTPNSTPGSGRR